MSKARELAELIGNAGGTSEQVLSGRRNLIINGDFQVNQRGDYSTATSLNNGAYTLDRWTCTNGVGATIQHRQDMPSGEYGKSVKVLTSSGGTAQCAIEQRIEVADWMYGKVITASAWVRSNSANASINIYNNTDGFWTAVSHSGNGTWEKLTITGTLPTSMTDFRVRIGLSQGGNTTIVSGDYFEIANVQLELGSVATPFEHRSYGEELALCQRYCYVLKAEQGYARYPMTWSDNTTYAHAHMEFPVPMRAVPTLTNNNISSSTVQCFSYTNAGTKDMTVPFNLNESSTRHAFTQCQTVAATSGASGMWRWVGSATGASMVFDAEL